MLIVVTPDKPCRGYGFILKKQSTLKYGDPAMDHKSVLFNGFQQRCGFNLLCGFYVMHFSHTQEKSMKLSHSTCTASGAETNSCVFAVAFFFCFAVAQIFSLQSGSFRFYAINVYCGIMLCERK